MNRLQQSGCHAGKTNNNYEYYISWKQTSDRRFEIVRSFESDEHIFQPQVLEYTRLCTKT
jgi:hypothetical protein